MRGRDRDARLIYASSDNLSRTKGASSSLRIINDNALYQ